jgi:hypothetical protein
MDKYEKIIFSKYDFYYAKGRVRRKARDTKNKRIK